ncbi:N(2)-fixation sustaining protein CowN [Candidatus Sulfurimonas baltica]|uniref:N(2)-fixation sustaining protein CowN n=1 Tax=Candidatus Sulfurimonas baltica TaxID=2740404 RepID=A0A7S7LYZ4_9BACT|nr:N(2)-fixation sustaining protein CowN [Candidatus Sulfurimonas baltica]QOY53149.1 N(2)-fixation sustaining protein CowN [Candidatus Sulfurimonas baltica]
MSEIKDRYITFDNIDCYENSALVIDAMIELFKLKPESKNRLWNNFMNKIPQNYREVFEKDGNKDTLYLVCANVFYISDLFEEYDFEAGIEVLEQVEFECC